MKRIRNHRSSLLTVLSVCASILTLNSCGKHQIAGLNVPKVSLNSLKGMKLSDLDPRKKRRLHVYSDQEIANRQAAREQARLASQASRKSGSTLARNNSVTKTVSTHSSDQNEDSRTVPRQPAPAPRRQTVPAQSEPIPEFAMALPEGSDDAPSAALLPAIKERQPKKKDRRHDRIPLDLTLPEDNEPT